MILKNEKELEILKEAGEMTNNIKMKALDMVKPGISTFEIDQFINSEIKKLGVKPVFLNYDAGDGPYPFSSCISINHQLVHGLPSKDSVIKKGDIVTIDMGILYKGLNTDTSYTLEVETTDQKHFLNVGKKALKKALNKAKSGNRIGDVSYEMQRTVEKNGYTVSRDLVGHGTGKKLHEPPQIPCFGKKNTGELLKENMVLAVEVMYMKGYSKLAIDEDGFSIVTKDKSLSAQFENTIVVTKDDPIVIV